jgi:hypothetical protein
MTSFSKQFVVYFQLEAEDVPEISEEFSISAVPTFIFIKVHCTLSQIVNNF